MNVDAEIYKDSNGLQKRDACHVLDEFADKIRWKNHGDKSIDIGCGDGGVTMELLKRHIPPNYERLLGCDISEKMVKYCVEHHSDERTNFTVMNIEGDLPGHLREGFDHAFSFYAMHWIRDQEHAFSNIFDLLKPGGDCLVMFLGRMPMFDVYRMMSRNNKWSAMLADVDQYISPYHDSPDSIYLVCVISALIIPFTFQNLQDPEKEITKMMEKIGFKNIEVRNIQKRFYYDDIDHLKKAVAAVNPFKIPKDMYDEYINDYLQVLRDMRIMDKGNNNLQELITIEGVYCIIVVYGSKNS